MTAIPSELVPANRKPFRRIVVVSRDPVFRERYLQVSSASFVISRVLVGA